MASSRCKIAELWELRLKRFPPILIRLLARDPRGAPLTTLEISTRSGLTEFMVEALSRSTDWEGVDLFIYITFCRACNLNLLDHEQFSRQQIYLQGKMNGSKRQPPQFTYLKKDPLWSSYYEPLMARYLKSLIKGAARV